MKKGYPSDLTDAEWNLIEPLLPARIQAGAPRKTNFRVLLNAIFYVNRTGCQWRMLPNDFEIPWQTVHGYFLTWKRNGLWDQINLCLVEQVRLLEGRENAKPSAGCIDSQTAKRTETTGKTGYDGGKNMDGTKRHIVTDTLGLLLLVVVTTANIDDGTAASGVLKRVDPRFSDGLRGLFADKKYHNLEFRDYLSKNHPDLELIIQTKDPEIKGFHPLRKRWVVERTFAWINKCRRNSKDYERLAESSEAMVTLSSIRWMIKRIGAR